MLPTTDIYNYQFSSNTVPFAAMPPHPKQRKIAIVGSRAVGTFPKHLSPTSHTACWVGVLQASKRVSPPPHLPENSVDSLLPALPLLLLRLP